MRLIRPNAAWNRKGPPVPCWFRLALKRFDPRMKLQFLPSSNSGRPFGVSPTLCPRGLWVINRQWRHTKLLRPKAVLMMTDLHGDHQPPSGGTMKLLRYARGVARSRQQHKLDDMADRAMNAWNNTQSEQRKQELRQEIDDSLSKMGIRLYTNRVRVL